MHSTTLKVLIGTLCLTVLIFIGSFFYYGNINDAEDPRILKARQILQQYERQLEEDQPGLALNLLDEMERIYLSTPGYAESYEMGVVLNNKATVYLVQLETLILTEGQVDKQEMIKTLETAKRYTSDAIKVYEKWLDEVGYLNKEQIRKKIAPFFLEGDPAFAGLEFDEVLQKRVDDIQLAQIETKRRLSVTLTNLGVINRYEGNLEEAKKNYEKAISLWERNYTAQDNLNILMDQPVKKRSIIDKLFPPERDKEAEKNS